MLAHIGAQLSAHQAIAAEQDAWGSVAQFAAEYETIAAVAQQPRWEAAVRATRLTQAEADAALASTAFGVLAAELRRAEADGYNAERLLGALVASRPLDDAGDIAAVLRERAIRALARANGVGRARQPATAIAGLLNPALGPMGDDDRAALRKRAVLIEQRADALVAEAVGSSAAWIVELGTEPADPQLAALWRREARTVAAYRDTYGINESSTLGLIGDDARQSTVAARARASVLRAHQLAERAGELEPTAPVARVAAPRL